MKLVTFMMLAVLLSVGYAFAGEGTPAPRTGEFPFVYTVQDLATGKCSLTTTFPDYHKYKIMGRFHTLDEAQKRMAENQDCK